MSRAQGDAKARRADRYSGRADGTHPDAAPPQPLGQLQGSTAFPHQQRLDGGIAGTQLPAQRLRPLSETGDEFTKLGAGLVSSTHQRDALAHGAGLGRRHMGAVDVVAGEVDQIRHQLATAAHKGAGHPERLAKGAHLDVHASRVHPLGRQGAAPLRPQHAEAVGIVDHQPVAAPGGQG